MTETTTSGDGSSDQNRQRHTERAVDRVELTNGYIDRLMRKGPQTPHQAEQDLYHSSDAPGLWSIGKYGARGI